MEVVIPLISAHMAISAIFCSAFVALVLIVYFLHDMFQW